MFDLCKNGVYRKNYINYRILQVFTLMGSAQYTIVDEII